MVGEGEGDCAVGPSSDVGTSERAEVDEAVDSIGVVGRTVVDTCVGMSVCVSVGRIGSEV